MKKIYILDTTLRDGEQVPGAKLNLGEKLEVAKELVKLKVCHASYDSHCTRIFKCAYG